MQDHLEASLAQLAGHLVRTHAAGRTDAGVHALMQVVHFDTTADRRLSAWVRGVNALLPGSVRVQWAHSVPDEFHARFSARHRSYQYLLVNQPVASAILDGKTGWCHRPLDVDAMRAAAAHLVGEHDFSAFRAAECQAKSPIKQLSLADVTRLGDCLLFHFRASAFLHHQVRNMVGALVYVGNGRHDPEWMAALLAEKNRTLAPPTFAPDGLYLTGVDYESHWGLPECQRGFGAFVLPVS